MVYKIVYATWYMQQVDNALQVGTKLEFKIEFRLSVIKPLHAKWLVEYYNHISSETGTEVIVNEFKLAGIYDAIRSGKSSLQSIDPFNDIAPLADSLSEGNPGNFVQSSDDLRERELGEWVGSKRIKRWWRYWMGPWDDFNRNAFDDFVIDDE